MTPNRTSPSLTQAIALDCTTLCFQCISFAASALSQLLTSRIGLILGLVIILVIRYARSPWRKVPPGPKGLPILGNALQLRDKHWMFEKSCKEKFRTSSPMIADSLNPQVYEKYFSEYHVFECPRPTHDRYQQLQACL
jgi:hypothetical protein